MIELMSLDSTTLAQSTSTSNATVTLPTTAKSRESVIIFNDSLANLWVHTGSTDTTAPTTGNSGTGVVISPGSTQSYKLPMNTTQISMKLASSTGTAYIAFLYGEKGV